MVAPAGLLALFERGDDCPRGSHSSGRVRYRGPEKLRLAADESRHRRQPGKRHQRRPVRQVLAIWPDLTVAADAREDDSRVDSLEFLVTQSQPVHHAGPEVLHHDVRFGHKTLDDLDPPRVAEIDRYALLALIPLVEHARAIQRRFHAVRRVRYPAPAIKIRAHGGLAANDLGAEVGQMHRGKRPRPDPRQIDDPNALQRTARL